MYRVFLVLLTFLFLFSCNEQSEKATEDDFRNKNVSKIDSLEMDIRKAIDEGRNPGLQKALELIKEYEIFAYKYEQDSLTPYYLFKSAQLFDGIVNDKERAANLYYKIYEEYTDFGNRPMMLFYQANALHDLGDTTLAIDRLKLFIARYPDHEFADDAQNLIDFIRMDPSKMEEFFGKSDNES